MMSKWTDLSHFINKDTPVYPGTEPPTIDVANTIEKDGFKEHCLRIYNHVGTHMDTPAHILPDGKNLNDFSVDTFQGAAICIDMQSPSLFNDLTVSLKKYTPEIILFKTGWDDKWGNPAYFNDYPTPTAEIINLLIGENIKAVGIDAISFDKVTDEHLPNHHQLLNNNILLLENLCNLHLLPKERFQLFFFPLKLDNLDASPVRVVANS